MSHRELHPTPDPDCFGCKVLSVNIGAGALENKGASVRAADAKDRELAKDLTAYKHLRDNGLQPKTVDGAHALEHSDIRSQFDIDLGRVVPKAEESRVREGFEFCRENGLMA